MTRQVIDKSSKINSDLPEISLVVPLYNEEESLEELTGRVKDALNGYSYELIFVDDGSKDRSWDQIIELSDEKNFVKGIRLRKNYGKSSALQAGFDDASGKYIVTLDADLQDDPFEIPGMIEKLKDGSDLVSGWKRKRHDPFSKTIPSRFFNAVTRWATGINLNDFNCGLKAYRKEVTENISLYGELHRYIPLLAKWQGYDRITEQVVKHHPRKYGKTKFGFSRFMKGFLDLVSLLFVGRYMQRPMHFFGTAGFIFSAVGFVINAYIAVLKIFYGVPIGNRPLFFLGILLLVVGVQLFSVGFLGEMINKNQEKSFKPAISKKIGL